MIERCYLVSGRVQGVGFRAFTRAQMSRLGITGTAVNLDDGRVEVRCSGTEAQLDALEEALWRGPVLSRVDAITVV